MSVGKGFKAVEILLIEDNPGDVRLTIEALKECKILNNLHVAEDGIKAMSYLKKEDKFKDEREVLEEIKLDKSLKKIPVVILATSEAEQDILESYELHANCYITKPVNMDQFIKVVKSIGEFWFSIVMLPPREDLD